MLNTPSYNRSNLSIKISKGQFEAFALQIVILQYSSHYLFHCPDYLQERMTLLNTVSCVVPNILDLNNAQLTEILLHGEENLDNINNTRISDATINCFNIINTIKIFDAELFWMELGTKSHPRILILY